MRRRFKGLSILMVFVMVLTTQMSTIFAKEVEWVIQPQFEEVYPFHEGLAAAQQDGLWGFIDKTGSWVIQPQYGYVDDFSEGLAVVGEDESYLNGYIDKTGKIIIPANTGTGFSYLKLLPFKSGVAPFGLGAIHNSYGIIDKTGKALIQPAYNKLTTGFAGMTEFNEGLAGASRYSNPDSNNEKLHLGVIDKNGKWVLQNLPYDNIYQYKEGLFAVSSEKRDKNYKLIDRKMGAIDKKGKLVIPQKYVRVWGFSEGLSAVAVGTFSNSKIGYIDKNNKMIINPQFKWGSSFGDGVAVASKQEVKEGSVLPIVGIIDKTGKFVIEPQFENACNASEGLIAVKTGGKWGFIKNPLT